MKMKETKATVILTMKVADGVEDKEVSVKIPCVINASDKDLTNVELINTSAINGISIEIGGVENEKA